MINGEKTLGTFLAFESAAVAECVGNTGVDYVIIDMEHSALDKSICTDLVRAAELAGTVPFVRISDVAHGDIQKAVDAGALGIIAPCLRTADEVKRLVDYAKFTPIGQRGFGPVRSDLWTKGMSEKLGVAGYMEYCNQRLLVLPQCETKEFLENIEDILCLEGVDGVFVGPFDLSISLGVPAQFDAPVFTAAIERILKACKAAGKFAFAFGGNTEVCKQRLAQGFDSVACGVDAILLTHAYRQMVAEMKGGDLI